MAVFWSWELNLPLLNNGKNSGKPGHIFQKSRHDSIYTAEGPQGDPTGRTPLAFERSRKAAQKEKSAEQSAEGTGSDKD
jgi:hypothetical protein